MTPVLLIALFWTLALAAPFVFARPLLTWTWREPYVADRVVIIESDDWGVGDALHAERLRGLCDLLARHRDGTGRPAVLTPNCVLAVPDIRAMRANGLSAYVRRSLADDFPEMRAALLAAMRDGLLVPQLHGIEHLNGEALLAAARENDPRVHAAFTADDWWDWETLDSPLQGHYVDGTVLPTRALPASLQQERVTQAMRLFRAVFGFASTTTVAPCYLWNDDTERAWAAHGVRFVQTSGWRCTGRAADGHYLQDPPWLRPGERSATGLRYLVRNVMYEPADGRGAQAAIAAARAAFRQALPAVISTHRYNFTRDAGLNERALAGLDRLLAALRHPALRHVSTPEFGDWLDAPQAALVNPANGATQPPLRAARGLPRIAGWLWRLWYRHRKLRVYACMTGLVIPLGLLAMSGRPRSVTPHADSPAF